MVTKIKILVVDDHKMIRDGIRTMLEAENKEYKFIITEAETGEQAINKIIHNDFDIVLMDYQLPVLNGPDTVKQMMIYKSAIKVLALSNHDEYAYIKNMMNAGAKGYVLKNIEPYELIVAIKTILSNKKYYANDVATKLLENESISDERIKYTQGVHITKRELEILEMIVDGLTNDKIANNLKLKKRTIDVHRYNLMNKLKVKNTAGLIKCTYELNLLK